MTIENESNPAPTQTNAYDNPDKRDYLFEDFLEYAEWEGKAFKFDIDKVTVFNQKWTPACTMYGGIHLVNILNLNEDRINWYPEREQINPATPRNLFCAERGNFLSWDSIQNVANWLKKKWYIEWYVTITSKQPIEKTIQQVDIALSMWGIATGSAFGDWAKIRKTGIYTDSDPKYFLGHAWDIVIKEKVWDYYKCMNSWGENRWPYKGYFLIHKNDLNKIYSKLVYIDKNDKDLFKNFAEIQKVKEAINTLRVIYNTTENKEMVKFLDQIQMGKNFSRIYWVQM